MEPVPNGNAGMNAPQADSIVTKLFALRDSLSQVSLLLKDLLSQLDLHEQGEATALSQALIGRLMNRATPDAHDRHGTGQGSKGET